MTCNVTLGLSWTTRYPHEFLAWFRRLDCAYRGPALFAEPLIADGSQVASIACDERLSSAEIDQLLSGPAAPVVFYLAGHGLQTPSGYAALLDHDFWELNHKVIRSAVAVLETCFLVDPSRKWMPPWQPTILGPELRLLLGFAGTATMSAGTTLRGRAFAELLMARVPIVEAWRRAIAQTSLSSQPDHPVAIVLGDDEADALDFANGATIDDLPKPRATAVAPHLHLVS